MSRKKTAGKVPGMTKILATAVVLTMVMMMSKNAFAASAVGTVLGHQCYASLGIGQVYGTAQTTCAASTSNCTVVVTLVYYYSSGGVVKKGSNTQSAVGTAAAYANAYGDSSGYPDSASSSHRVTYSTATPWETSLYVHY